MAETSTDLERRSSARMRRETSAAPTGLGLLKGLGVTIKHLFQRAATQPYPHEQPDLAPRTRGVIALMDENCTVCMLCARECPDWCIYIDSHKEKVPPAREGGRERTRNVLDRFAIDFALCMYCGICVEVCPFDALFWSPEFEYSEYEISDMTHEMDRLREWMDTVPAPPPLDEGADSPPEVADALETAERQLEEAREQRRREAEQEAAAPDGAEAGTATRTEQETEDEDEVEVEGAGEELDQETYDRLIEEGRSERIARAKAKAAYIRKAKQQAREEREAATEGDDAPSDGDGQALADVEVEGAGEELDQETYDRLIEEGRSERIARARAKAAWVRQQKREQLEGDDAGAPAGGAEGDGEQQA